MIRNTCKMALSLSIILMFIATSGEIISAQSQSPGLTVTAPANTATLGGTDVTVIFSVTNFHIVPTTVPLSEAGKRPDLNRPGQGHLHFILDLQPLVVWTQNAPYTFHNVPPGDHTLMVELANNDHSVLSPRVMKMIQFRTQIGLPHTGLTSGLYDWNVLALLGLTLMSAGWLLRRQHNH